MSEPSDLEARLARLAARKAATAPATPTSTASGTTGVPVANTSRDLTPASRGKAGKRTRRRHPAAAGRILSAGLSSSAFLSIVAAFGSQTPASGASTGTAAKTRAVAAASPTTQPKVVVKDVHHVEYVDQWGRPIPAASLPKGLTATPTSGPAAAGTGPKQPAGTSLTGPPRSLPSSSPPPSGPSLPSTANTGGPSPSPSGPAPHAPVPAPSQPSPATTPHTSPAPTPPPVTSPPATVVTTPPPPPPPACSGTKCP